MPGKTPNHKRSPERPSIWAALERRTDAASRLISTAPGLFVTIFMVGWSTVWLILAYTLHAITAPALGAAAAPLFGIITAFLIALPHLWLAVTLQLRERPSTCHKFKPAARPQQGRSHA